MIRACCLGIAWAFAGLHAHATIDRDASRVDAALTAAAAGRTDQTLALGAEMIAADAADWRGWYLRGLAQNARPLDAIELARLESVEPELQETFRGTLRYLAGSPDVRGALTRRLVEQHPDSALAHTLLASSLLPLGGAEEAQREAERALELDPGMFLAARVQLVALDAQDDAEGIRMSSCALLARFPFDSVVVGRTMGACAPDLDFTARFAHWEPLLRVRRGAPEAIVALQRLLADPCPDTWPSSLQRRVVSDLDPSDRGLWPLCASLLSHLGGPALTEADRGVIGTFVEGLQNVSMAVDDPHRDEMLESAALVLAEFRVAQNSGANARTGLEAASLRLPALKRPRLLLKLAELECASGLKRAASAHAADAFVLAHPFHELPASLPGACGGELPYNDARARAATLLERLDTFTLTDAAGNVRSFGAPSGTSTLLVFWSAHCPWSTMEAKRLAGLLVDPTSAFATHSLELVWVNRDPVDQKTEALAWAREQGLILSTVFFLGNDRRLGDALRVVGSPALVLVTPGGRVAWETHGYRPKSWIGDIDDILDALN